jgi:hypothetical protein
MRMVRLAFTPRFVAYTLSILLTAAPLVIILVYPLTFDLAVLPLAMFAGLVILGTHDLIQTRHAVLRNYPISAHLRFLLEQVRPEMRQYFFEDDKDGRQFSRDKRAVVYQRAKMVLDKVRSGPSTTSMQRDSSGSAIRSCHGRRRSLRSASKSAVRIARDLMRRRYSTSQP